jgi:cytochrome c5
MTNPTNSQELCERIEHLVQAHISATRAAAQAAVERAFATPAAAEAKRSRHDQAAARAHGSGVRRASEEIEVLSDRLYEAVCKMPGETMTVLAPMVGATARELNRPMLRLKRAGRVRSVGTRHATRYFPMAREAQRPSA